MNYKIDDNKKEIIIDYYSFDDFKKDLPIFLDILFSLKCVHLSLNGNKAYENCYNYLKEFNKYWEEKEKNEISHC